MRITIASASMLLVTVLFGFLGSSLKAQTICSYQIINESTYSIGLMTTALESANLDSYRKATLRRTITFDNGAEVVLYSANELVNSGCTVNASLAMADNTPLNPNRSFSIHPSGRILEQVETRLK